MSSKNITTENTELTINLDHVEINKGIYIVAIHIGNLEDITIRALSILSKVDFIICEDRKNGSRLLKYYNISNKIEVLNEHNETENSKNILNKIRLEGLTAALISDCGTPLFEDPGNLLVRLCLENGIKVFSAPGASSLTAALMTSGLKTKSFFYYGFLPANKKARIRALKSLGTLNKYNLIFLDTPYRLKQVLVDMNNILGKHRTAVLQYRLTHDNEKTFWGSLSEILKQVTDLEKGEFVLIINADSSR